MHEIALYLSSLDHFVISFFYHFILQELFENVQNRFLSHSIYTYGYKSLRITKTQ